MKAIWEMSDQRNSPATTPSMACRSSAPDRRHNFEEREMGGLMKLALAAIVLTATAHVSFAQQMPPPFGKPDDVADAAKLWQALEKARMVGPNSLAATTYEGGTAPHTKTLITLQGKVTVDGHNGLAIVKKNFADGENAATEEQVFADPGKYLLVLTIMYQRERGYDAENQDWFYAIFMPNGTVRKAPNGMQLAGRIAKGMTLEQMPVNCIACHKLADGDDFVYLHNGVPKR